MIDPPPFRRIEAIEARIPKKLPSTITDRMLRHCSVVVFSSVALRPNPALLTRTASGP